MKKYKSLIAVLVFFAALFFFIPLGKKEKCLWQENFNNKNYSGVVINKFIDSSQHSTPIVEIKNQRNSLIDSLDLFGDKSNVFNLVNKNDTLIKSPKSNKVFIKHNDKLTLLGVVDFDCNK